MSTPPQIGMDNGDGTVSLAGGSVIAKPLPRLTPFQRRLLVVAIAHPIPLDLFLYFKPGSKRAVNLLISKGCLAIGMDAIAVTDLGRAVGGPR